MSLRGALAGRRLVALSLPEVSRTAQLAARLSTTSVGITARPAIDLDIVADRFIRSVASGKNPDARDWNKAAWCLWTTRPALAEHDPALDALLGRVARMERKRPYRQLALSYLTDYAPERPRIERVAGVLAQCASRAGEPWREGQERHRLFDGLTAPRRLAAAAIESRTNVQGLFETIGMGGALTEAGFAEAVHTAGLERLRASPVAVAEERLEVIRRWCLRSETLIFPQHKAEMARALVLPLGDRIPAPAERNIILDFLLARFGDPRVKPAQWIGMDDIAAVLKRWLVQLSLRQFFEVIDKIAQQSQWIYRGAFWQAYFDHDPPLMRNAWVIFGPHGAAQAKRSFGRDASFGTFRTGGRRTVMPNHAVLLMDFGQCIVADWSHNGYCNIWPMSDASRPRNLNATSYTSDDVSHPLPVNRTEENLTSHDIFRHGGSDNYVWQDRVARRLHELTGVLVPRSAYRVR